MYYLLNETRSLRSFQDKPFMIIDLTTGAGLAVHPDTFQTLLCCDGKTNADELPEEVRERLRQLEELGLASRSDEPAELKPAQKHRVYPNVYVERAHWSTTGRCNLRCRHCYLAELRNAAQEIPHEKALDVVSQLSDAGITRVGLSGGEPLARKNLLGLVDEILAKGMIVEWIETNTLLITPEFIEALLSRGLKPLFCIGFDGVGWHDWLRGKEGAEDAVVEKIRLLRSYGLNIFVETVFHKKSIGALGDTLKLLAGLGVSHWKITHAEPSGAWVDQDQSLNMTLEDILAHHLAFAEVYLRAGAPLDMQYEEFGVFYKGGWYQSLAQKSGLSEEEHLSRPACNVLRSRIYITPDALLMPCMPFAGHPETAGECPNLYETTISEALTSSPYLDKICLTNQDFFAHNEECRVCEHKRVCLGGCRAGGAEETGDFLGIDSWTCTYVKGGYEAKFLALCEKYRS